MPTKDQGKHIWRGGEKIALARESSVFTAVVKDAGELDRLKGIPGVKDVRRVGQQIFKIYVEGNNPDSVMQEIRSDEVGGVCHHAYRPKEDENTRYYLTDQIIIKFKPDLSEHEVGQVLHKKKLKLLKQYVDQEKTYLVQVTSATGKNPLKVANELVDEGTVVYAEPNLVNRFRGFYEPQDTYFAHQWHLKSRAGTDLVEEADVSATRAWDITLGSRKVVVAILDDGFDLQHPDFRGEGKIVFPKDFVGGDSYPFPGRDNYHGTPCAGVAIAEENSFGVVGVAPRCAFMPVRFPLSANDDLMMQVFDYAGRYADVISCSWGPPPVDSPLPQILKDKFRTLAETGGPRRQGCVVVFAAGNHNAPINAPNNSYFEWFDYSRQRRITSGRIINGYAASPDVLTVAASTSLNKKALYSNWGSEVAVCAPSDNFDPANGMTTAVAGRGIWTTDNERYGSDFTPGSEFTAEFGGTSSAAPLVAGIAGLVLAANIDLTAEEVKEIIRTTADRMDDPGAPSDWCGSGKVNAFRAVQKAKESINGANGWPTTGTISVPARMIKRSQMPELFIPDNSNPGVKSVIDIEDAGIITDIKVFIDISHSYIGDLSVRLTSSSGKSVILHNNTGGSQRDLKQSYDSALLQCFLNEPAAGNWLLTVEDKASGDVGVLKRWELEFLVK